MTITINHITFDCADAAALAAFWSGVVGQPVDDGASADFATITSPTAVSWMFVKVPEAKQVKNRVHVDLGADDLAAELDRIVALGASQLGDHDEFGARWTTLADPEGNEFDVVQAG
ncbi:MAG: VOC family protein [Ilumatobacteraceae bacterium]